MGGVLDEVSAKRLEEGLGKLDLVPVTGSISVGEGRFSTDVKIPLKTIKAGVDYFESEKAAQEVPDSIPEEPAPPVPENEEETEPKN
jgi:hypothetical protein